MEARLLMPTVVNGLELPVPVLLYEAEACDLRQYHPQRFKNLSSYTPKTYTNQSLNSLLQQLTRVLESRDSETLCCVKLLLLTFIPRSYQKCQY